MAALMASSLTPHPTEAAKPRKPAATPVNNERSEQTEEIETIEPADATSADDTADWYGEAYPRFDRILDHLNARSVRKHDFSTLFAHRNSEGLLRNPVRDLLGFDGGGLKIALALRFGILDQLDVGILRQNGTVEVFDTYELDARYQILRQEKHKVDLAVRAGVSLFNQPSNNAAGVFAELMFNRLIANRLIVGAAFIYHTNSTGPNKSNSDAGSSAALAFYEDFRIVESLSLAAEVTVTLSGFHDSYPVITLGPKIITNRHTFSLVISNSQYMSVDSVITGTYRMTPNDWVFGFHITREI